MNDILNKAMEYLDEGFSVIPVDPATKKPLISWKKYQTEYPTTEDLEGWWEKYPNANVAIITGKLSGLVVIDADSKTGCQWVTKHAPKTTVYVITSKGFHAYYRYPFELEISNAVRMAPDVDIRGEGGYVVAPPSMHSAGVQYGFKFIGDGFDEMPEFAPMNGMASLFKTDKPQESTDTQKGNLNINLGGVKTSPINAGVAKGSRNNTLATLAGDWINKGLDFDEIFELAKAWNKTNSPPLGEKELKITIRSILKLHKTNHIEVAETPEIEEADESSYEPVFPGHILNPGGTLGRMIDYIERSTTVSIPLFSLGAALCGLGAVIGQKVMTETGLRTNLYCINLGYSGSGKDGAIKALPKLLRMTNAQRIIGPSELASETSLFRWLANTEQARSILCMDEIGQVMAGMQSPHSPQAGIPRLLTKLFSGTDSPEIKVYADQNNNIFIAWHHVSLLGATTPERWWQSIRPSEVSDGFLARALIFEFLGEAPMPKVSVDFSIPNELIKEINDLYAIEHAFTAPQGNLDNCRIVPIPNVIPKTAEALEFFKAFAEKYHDLKNSTRKNTLGIASIYGRAAEHAHKIALIHSISCHGAKCENVGIESVKWACELVDILTNNLVNTVIGSVSDTETGKWKHKLLAGIKAYTVKNRKSKGYAGASIRDLQRGPGQDLKTKELKEIIESMIVAETIGKKSCTAKNGKKVDYFYVAK